MSNSIKINISFEYRKNNNNFFTWEIQSGDVRTFMFECDDGSNPPEQILDNWKKNFHGDDENFDPVFLYCIDLEQKLNLFCRNSDKIKELYVVHGNSAFCNGSIIFVVNDEEVFLQNLMYARDSICEYRNFLLNNE